ncbi:MFS transporter [Yimella sp. cx-573]|nr:MFS transporter [Yimella sp. cx-573]
MRHPLGSREAVLATVTTFIVNGIGVGTVGALMPTLADRWDTDARGLGVLLMVFGLAAIAGINIGGRMADRGGALRPIRLGLVTMTLGIALIAASPSLWVAVVLAAVYGFGNGLVDTTMNVLAVEVERARPKPLMSRFHACWSIGSLSGALIVLLSGWLFSGAVAISVAAFALAATLIAENLPVVHRYSADTAPVVHHDESGNRTSIPRAAWILAAMAVGFGMAEGTAFDWSSVHVRDVADVSTSNAAWGLAAFSVCMVGVRMAGDFLVHALGRRLVVRIGAGIAAVGYCVAVLGSGLWMLLLGWALVGTGMALVAPQIYGLAGLAGGGRTLSLVVTFGYATTLVGPGLMGLLVHDFGVQDAMILPLVAACGVSMLSWVMPTEQTLAKA